MQHKHKNIMTQNKHNKQKTRFSRLLWHLAWNQNGLILESKR